ncbi:TPA: hypothetical protein L3934_006042 [Pseudomonas aeruginosa]|uniref:hypothetical protein n=1 Tax=Pseudomonas aeruginosa TaxID=287 RepID=UPI00136F79BF|nr:hypothetical protein [Pseudomonas aeruginosa]MXU53629.1 hypothetical protein [Pseudomonas aeruginosa]HBN9848018.1 hypothetical protein [Pseudomonas aeruginosa]
MDDNGRFLDDAYNSANIFAFSSPRRLVGLVSFIVPSGEEIYSPIRNLDPLHNPGHDANEYRVHIDNAATVTVHIDGRTEPLVLDRARIERLFRRAVSTWSGVLGVNQRIFTSNNMLWDTFQIRMATNAVSANFLVTNPSQHMLNIGLFRPVSDSVTYAITAYPLRNFVNYRTSYGLYDIRAGVYINQNVRISHAQYHMIHSALTGEVLPGREALTRPHPAPRYDDAVDLLYSAIFLHELGHAFGLAHSSAQVGPSTGPMYVCPEEVLASTRARISLSGIIETNFPDLERRREATYPLMLSCPYTYIYYLSRLRGRGITADDMAPSFQEIYALNAAANCTYDYSPPSGRGVGLELSEEKKTVANCTFVESPSTIVGISSLINSVFSLDQEQIFRGNIESAKSEL